LRILAHRGLHQRATENSLPAFEGAFANGLDGIELDVQLAHCGTPVVFHDSSLERLFGISNSIQDLTLNELSTLRATEARPDDRPSCYIPTLRRVLETAPAGKLINVELKASRFQRRTPARATAQLLAEFTGLDLIVSSFHPLELMRFRHSSNLPLALLVDIDHGPLLSPTILGSLIGITALHPHRQLVSREFVEDAHRRGWRVHAWTVNDPEEAERMRVWGVDAIISDRPLLMADFTPPGASS
jgi:glycerophosphoryl diester phosphodiesterase